MNKEDLGASASPKPALLAAAPLPEPASGLGPTGDDPARDGAYDRLHKFAVEWRLSMSRGGYCGTVYELHPGDPRHAVCNISDIIALLEMVDKPPNPGGQHE